MATLTAGTSPLRKWQFDYVESLDLNLSGESFGMWNHVPAIAASTTLAIATDPAEPLTGRNVLKMTSSANTAQATLKTQQQYSANGSVDASPTGSGTCVKMLMHIYLHWAKATQIVKTDEFTFLKLLYGGNVDTNAAVTMRLTGSGAGTDASQLQVGFLDAGDGARNWAGDGSGDTIDLDLKGKWMTLYLEWRNNSGSSDGSFAFKTYAGKFYTVAALEAAIAADAAPANWVGSFTGLTTDDGFSQFAFAARNNAGLASNTSTLAVSAVAGVTGFGDVALSAIDAPEIVADPMVGMLRDVSTTAANVFIRAQGGYYKANWNTDGAIRASVRYWVKGANESTASETAKVTLDGSDWWANLIRVSGLTPDTDYYFRVRLYDETNDGDYVDAGHTLDVKLLPTDLSDMVCMHAHCAAEDGRMHPYTHFGHALDAGVRYVFYTDDIGYQDVTFKAETVDEFKLGYLHFFSDQDLCKLSRQAAFFFKLGDHQTRNDAEYSDRTDTGLMNDISGVSGYGATTTVQEVDAAGREAFYDWIIRGMEGLLTDGGAWDSTEMYRAIPTGTAQHGTLFVFPNDVQFRDASSGTLWGSTQEAAIKAAILANKRPLIVLFPVRLNGPAAFVYVDNYRGDSDFHDWWNAFEQWCASNVSDSKIIAISGDRHLHEANTRFQAGVDGRVVDVSDQWLLEWTTGPSGYRQWDIDLTGEVGDPADGAATRLSQYTPGTNNATFMKVWTLWTLGQSSGSVALQLYDEDNTAHGDGASVSVEFSFVFGSVRRGHRVHGYVASGNHATGTPFRIFSGDDEITLGNDERFVITGIRSSMASGQTGKLVARRDASGFICAAVSDKDNGLSFRTPVRLPVGYEPAFVASSTSSCAATLEGYIE